MQCDTAKTIGSVAVTPVNKLSDGESTLFSCITCMQNKLSPKECRSLVLIKTNV